MEKPTQVAKEYIENTQQTLSTESLFGIEMIKRGLHSMQEANGQSQGLNGEKAF